VASFLFYCKPGNIGNPVAYFASNQFDRLQSGDELWAVVMVDGELHLQGHMTVQQVVSRPEAERLLGRSDLWDATTYAIGESPAEPRRDLDITELATGLTFEGGVERLPERWTGQSLQTMRRLSAESAVALRQTWTSGHRGRNPAWERDELILALDLYFQLHRRVPDDGEAEVIALSELLNALPIHAERPDDQRFRNPNGVALKLANFRALDQPGRGMSRGGKGDREVWDEFASDPNLLHRMVVAIRRGYSTLAAQPAQSSMADDDEASFAEGRVIFRLHRARERSRDLVEKKKAHVLGSGQQLACEACGFDFAATYGSLGQGYIECHHARPLSDVAEPTTTRLVDLVLVCSNCHRMIHRKRPWLTVDSIRKLVAASSR
jgi:5-methylcytosine-specific restriction protein A